MIQPSQRISAKETPRDPLRLHGDYAKKRYWHLRLLYCASAATLASFVAYLLQIPWLWHGVLLLLGFGLGFVVPVRTVGEWALGFIEKQIGFSYRTALEYSESDSYGFGQAVKARAARFTRSLAAPQLQPWWLLLMVLALVFMILPQFNLAQQGGAVGGPPSNPISPQTNPPPPEAETGQDDDPDLDTDQDQSQEEEEQSPEEGLEDNRTPDNSENFDTPGNSRSEAEGNRPVDSETLDRFLENLSEMPPEVEEEQPEGSAPDRQGGNGNPEQRPDTDRLEQGEEQEGEQGETGDQGQQEAQQGEESQEGQDGEQAEGEQQGEGEDQGQQQGQDEQAGTADPDGDQELGQGSSDPEGEEGLQEGPEGEPGDGAGDSPSAALPTEIMEEINQNDPELIQGRLQRGPSSVAGEIRMPGSQELDLQSGNVQEDYSQALERAVSEGRIPVEYQEILRNYFR